MTQDCIEPSPEYSLPTEVWLYVFTYLPAKQLVRIRQVCARWRNIIDGLVRSDSFWREHCKRDYNDIYKVARYKARIGTLWFNIYRSLTLWPQLLCAKEIRDEFASASRVDEEINGLQVLGDGIIGVHKSSQIVYYDIETLEPAKRQAITGSYAHYAEDQDTILIRSYHLHLFIIRKNVANLTREPTVTFDNVKVCLMVSKDVFYVDLNNDVHVCNLAAGTLTNTLLKRSQENIMCLGYTDRLHYLTFQRNIYSFVNGSVALTCNLDEHPNLLHQLYKYNLLESVDWKIVVQWLYVLRRKVPDGPLQEILTIRVYGNVFLVGCNWGVFRIYYAPFIDGEFDLYNCEPVKQYNFMERFDCPVLTMCPILKVDALEAEDGHTIVVAMPKKIAVLDFIHSFKRTASVAMLPYSDMQRVKVLRLDNYTV